MRVVLLSSSKGKDKYRIDYSSGENLFVETFEDVRIGILETSFDANGEVLDQKLLKKEVGIEEAARSFLRGVSGEIKLAEYAEVEIAKACPKCGSTNVKRDIDALKEGGIPMVPRYVCTDCGAHSYRLTDKYLEKLVYSNRHMFSKEELDALDRDSAAFMKELKEYIIRIFASKKIMEIR
ncbi:MAG: hypothetical protein ACP5MZ_02725 [Candidatus Micrarchaeia archaeon]